MGGCSLLKGQTGNVEGTNVINFGVRTMQNAFNLKKAIDN
jgi:hypothetical protein